MPPSRWVVFVKEFAARNNLSYGCALSMPECSREYRKKYGSSDRGQAITKKVEERRAAQTTERNLMGEEDMRSLRMREDEARAREAAILAKIEQEKAEQEAERARREQELAERAKESAKKEKKEKKEKKAKPKKLTAAEIQAIVSKEYIARIKGIAKQELGFYGDTDIYDNKARQKTLLANILNSLKERGEIPLSVNEQKRKKDTTKLIEKVDALSGIVTKSAKTT